MRIALRTLAPAFIVSARAAARRTFSPYSKMTPIAGGGPQLGLLALVTVMLAVPVGVNAQTKAAADQSSEAQEVKAIVERFYKLETAGTWLGDGRWDELQNFFADIGPSRAQASISVLKSCQIDKPKKIVYADGSVHYGVDVDCFEWGSINTFLRFTRARNNGQAVERRLGESLSLSDQFVATGPSGKEEKRKGSLIWRMRDFGPVDSVDVDTAVRWVTERSEETNDPAIKYNAEKTLSILKSLSAGARMPPQSIGASLESALRVAQRFVHSEVRSTPDQWDELASFFVETPRPDWSKVYVVDVRHVDTDIDGQTRGDSSEVTISVRPFGELDSSLHFRTYSRLPGNNSACCDENYLGFTLVLSDRHWQVAPDGTVKQFDGPLGWRVEDTSFNPIVTLDTAIRYVAEERDKNVDSIVRKNAASALAILKSRKRSTPPSQ